MPFQLQLASQHSLADIAPSRKSGNVPGVLGLFEKRLVCCSSLSQVGSVAGLRFVPQFGSNHVTQSKGVKGACLFPSCMLLNCPCEQVWLPGRSSIDLTGGPSKSIDMNDLACEILKQSTGTRH